MTFPRIPHVSVGAIGAGSALGLSAIAPLVGFVGTWGALTAVHALAVAATAVLAMLVAGAGVLIAADARADFQSWQAWAQFEPAAVEWSLPVDIATPPDIDPRYLPAVDNEALRCVFRAHRLMSPEPALQAIKELPTAICARRIAVGSAEPIPARTTPDVGPEITCNRGIGTMPVSEGGKSDRALRKLASSAEASITVASRRVPPLALRAERAAPRTRAVANANAWFGWPVPDECMLTRTPPGWHTADIIVLGNSRDDQAQPLPDGSTHSNIASSTEPPSCRGPPQVVGRRSRATEATPANLLLKRAHQLPAAGALPTADPIVRDNLGYQVPICAAELDAIETYLDQVLWDLLASSTAGSGQEEA
jgi:hypothetical protein